MSPCLLTRCPLRRSDCTNSALPAARPGTGNSGRSPDRTVAGALTLTLLGDVIFAVHLPSYWTVLADGLLLIAAVLAGTGLQALQARRAGGGA